MNNEKTNSTIKLSNNSSFVILKFVILKFRNIGRSTFLRFEFYLVLKSNNLKNLFLNKIC